jgi:hypothetical protein
MLGMPSMKIASGRYTEAPTPRLLPRRPQGRWIAARACFTLQELAGNSRLIACGYNDEPIKDRFAPEAALPPSQLLTDTVERLDTTGIGRLVW